MHRAILLGLEFSAVFVGVPLLIYFRVLPNWPIPYLLGGGLAAFLWLWTHPASASSSTFGWRHLPQFLFPLLARDALLVILLGAAVWLLAPDLLFSFVKHDPRLWKLVMVLYPLLSVYPQELLYRAYFFRRYAPLFGSGWTMLIASALAFGFVHIIFGNWLAVGLCVIGGLLFSFTYQSSGSLLLTCVDHAIFGNFIFTIGLGQFFYHGSRVLTR
jgi:uncharacterized protein